MQPQVNAAHAKSHGDKWSLHQVCNPPLECNHTHRNQPKITRNHPEITRKSPENQNCKSCHGISADSLCPFKSFAPRGTYN